VYKYISTASPKKFQNMSLSCRPFDSARVQAMCAHPFAVHDVYQGMSGFTERHRYAIRIYESLIAMSEISFKSLIHPTENDFSGFIKDLQRVAVQSEMHFFAVSDVLLKESFVFELERNFEEVLERLVRAQKNPSSKNSLSNTLTELCDHERWTFPEQVKVMGVLERKIGILASFDQDELLDVAGCVGSNVIQKAFFCYDVERKTIKQNISWHIDTESNHPEFVDLENPKIYTVAFFREHQGGGTLYLRLPYFKEELSCYKFSKNLSNAESGNQFAFIRQVQRAVMDRALKVFDAHIHETKSGVIYENLVYQMYHCSPPPTVTRSAFVLCPDPRDPVGCCTVS